MLDGRRRPLLLEGGEQAGGPERRLGQLGLGLDVVDVARHGPDLEERDEQQPDQRNDQSGRELQPDRNPSHPASPSRRPLTDSS